jgi:hypothetical protein
MAQKIREKKAANPRLFGTLLYEELVKDAI